MTCQPGADRRIDPEERKIGNRLGACVCPQPIPAALLIDDEEAPLLMCMVDVTSARIISVSRSSCKRVAAVRLRRLSIKPASYLAKEPLVQAGLHPVASGCIATAVRSQEHDRRKIW